MLKSKDVSNLIVSTIVKTQNKSKDNSNNNAEPNVSAHSDISTSVHVSSNTEHKHSHEFTEINKVYPQQLEALSAEEISKLSEMDYLHDNNVIQWFKNTKIEGNESRVRTDKLTLEAQLRRHKDPKTLLQDEDYVYEDRKNLLDCVQQIYHAAKTDEVMIVAKSRNDAALLFVHFRTQFVTQLNRSELNNNEFGNVLMPNGDFSKLLGFTYLPLDRDCLTAPSDSNDTRVPYETTFFNSNIEFKLPAILLKDGPKTLNYILKRIEALGFSPDLFKAQTLYLSEVLDFPELATPYDNDTKALFEKSEQSKFLRQQNSQQFPGHMRVLTDNLEALKKALFAQARLPKCDPNYDSSQKPTTIAEVLEHAMQQLLHLESELLEDSKHKESKLNAEAFNARVQSILQHPIFFGFDTALDDTTLSSHQLKQALSHYHKECGTVDANFVKSATNLIQNVLMTIKDMWAKFKIEEMFVPKCCLGIEPLLFKELFINIQQKANKDSMPSYLRLGHPYQMGKEFLIPAEINLAPKLEKSSKTLTIFVQDISESMKADSVTWDSWKNDWGPCVANERLVACKIALRDQLEKLSRLNNQEICLITLSDSPETLISQQSINRNNLAEHLAKIETMAARGGTKILPTLKQLVAQVKEALAKDPNINIQVLALTDGGFQDYNEAEIASILSSVPKMPIRFIALFDIDYGNPSLQAKVREWVQSVQNNVKFVVNQGLIGRGQGQIVSTMVEDIYQTMNKLVIKTDNTVHNVTDITLQFNPADNVCVSSYKIPSFHSGIPHFFHIPCSQSTFESFELYKAEHLRGKIKVTLENESNVVFDFAVPMRSFKKMLQIPEFNENHYCTNEWLPIQCLTQNLGDSLNLAFEVYSKLYTEATTLGNEKLRKHLRKLMKHFITEFERGTIEKTYATKSLRLEAYLEKMKELVASNNLVFAEVLKPCLDFLQSDCDIALEKYVFKSANVDTVSQLDALPLDNLFTVYNGILEAYLKNPNELNLTKEVDPSIIKASLTQKRDLTLIKLKLCEIAKQAPTEQTVNNFISSAYSYNVTDAERLRVLQTLLEVINSQISGHDYELLKTIRLKVKAIAFKGWFEQITGIKTYFSEYFISRPSGISVVDQYLAYNTIIHEKAIAQEFVDLRGMILENYIKPLWREAELCIVAKVKDIEIFNQLPLPQQMDAYLNLRTCLNSNLLNNEKVKRKLASENLTLEAPQIAMASEPKAQHWTQLGLTDKDIKMAIQEIQTSIDTIWVDCHLCILAKKENLSEFNQLPDEQRLAIYQSVMSRAEGEINKTYLLDINKRIVSLKAEMVLLEAIIASGKAKSYKEFQNLEETERSSIIKDAIKKVPQHEKAVLAKLEDDLEISSNFEDPMFLQKQVEQIIYKHCNHNASAYDLCGDPDVKDPWAKKEEKLNEVLKQLKANGPKIYAEYLEKMIEADKEIFTRIRTLSNDYVFKARPRIEKECNDKGIPYEANEEWIALQGFGKIPQNVNAYRCRPTHNRDFGLSRLESTYSSDRVRMLKTILKQIISNRKLEALSGKELFLVQRINLRINRLLSSIIFEQFSRFDKKLEFKSEKILFDANEALLKEYAPRICLLYMKGQLFNHHEERALEKARAIITKHLGFDVNFLPSLAEVRALDRSQKPDNPSQADIRASIEREKADFKASVDVPNADVPKNEASGVDDNNLEKVIQSQPVIFSFKGAAGSGNYPTVQQTPETQSVAESSKSVDSTLSSDDSTLSTILSMTSKQT